MLELIIGRDPVCDVVIDDQSVSRRHAKLIIMSDRQHVISDFGSKHGTFIKEGGTWRRVSSAELQPDDEVRLGLRVLSVSSLVDAARKARPKAGRGAVERNPETGEIVPKR